MAQNYYGPMNNMPVSGTPYGYAMGQVVPASGYPGQMPMPMPQMQMAQPPMMNRNGWMITVDGEMAAKAWPTPQEMRPGDVIPLWDVDGVHVYFKSLDGYGRLNPTRKARIIFEDETPALPENTSGSSDPRRNTEMDQYVSKTEFDNLRNDIASIRQMLSANRQNGRNSSASGQQTNRGGSENA